MPGKLYTDNDDASFLSDVALVLPVFAPFQRCVSSRVLRSRRGVGWGLSVPFVVQWLHWLRPRPCTEMTYGRADNRMDFLRDTLQCLAVPGSQCLAVSGGRAPSGGDADDASRPDEQRCYPRGSLPGGDASALCVVWRNRALACAGACQRVCQACACRARRRRHARQAPARQRASVTSRDGV